MFPRTISTSQGRLVSGKTHCWRNENLAQRKHLLLREIEASGHRQGFLAVRLQPDFLIAAVFHLWTDDPASFSTVLCWNTWKWIQVCEIIWEVMETKELKDNNRFCGLIYLSPLNHEDACGNHPSGVSQPAGLFISVLYKPCVFHRFASVCPNTYWTEQRKITRCRDGTKHKGLMGKLSRAAGCGQNCAPRKSRAYAVFSMCIFDLGNLQGEEIQFPSSLLPWRCQAHAQYRHFGSIICGHIGEAPTDLNLEQWNIQIEDRQMMNI